MTIPVLIIGGPTASGKSNLALDLAQEANGFIINGDSLQIYKGLNILTASPTDTDKHLVPHRLYGIMGPGQACTVALWQDMALEEIKSAQGRLPIVVGGTGLYLNALVEGLSHIPSVSASVRSQARQEYETLGQDAYHQRLRQVDPLSATKINAGDQQRLTRAWEVYLQTGKPLSQWQSQKDKNKISQLKISQVVLLPDREALYKRAEERFMKMIQQGALEEVREMMTILPSSHPLSKALGFAPLALYLKDQLTLDEAMERSIVATRQYIKRQYTWFRNQVREALILEEVYFSEESPALKNRVLDFLKSKK